MENNKSFMHTFWKFIGDTEVELDKLFGKQAPAIPQSGREVIVMILPWLAVIAVILLVPCILFALGLSAFLAPFGGLFGSYTNYFSFFISTILFIVYIVLLCLAIPALFKRMKAGWNYLYVIQLLLAVQNLLTLNLVILILGFLIGMYILFQVRPLYLGQKHVDGPTPPPSTPVQPSGM